MKKILYILFLICSMNGFAQSFHYKVTKTTDSNPSEEGELRYAFEKADDHPGLDYIDFDINQTPPIIIQMSPVNFQQLVTSKSPVFIDGNSQPANGYTGIEPKIHIRGTGTPNSHISFNKNSDYNNPTGSTIKNITFSNFNHGAGIICLVNTDNILIESCVFLENLENTFGSAIGMDGSYGNNAYGGADSNKIIGCYFGTNRAKTITGNLAYGVHIMRPVISGTTNHVEESNYNEVGGNNVNDKNYFYNIRTSAVYIYANRNNPIKNNVYIGNNKNIRLYGYSGVCGNNCKSKPIITKAEIIGNNITVEGTSEANDYVEIYKSNLTGKDAEFLIGTATANSSGNWSFTVPKGTLTFGLVIGTATDNTGNTSEFSGMLVPISNPCAACPSQSDFIFSPSPPIFKNQYVTFTGTTTCSGTISYSWDFDDPASGVNNTSTLPSPTHSFVSTGTHIVKLTTTRSGCTAIKPRPVSVSEQLPCENCIGSFAPEPGNYILSAWVKEEGAVPTRTSFSNPQIKIYFSSSPTVLGNLAYTCTPSGAIIDGWQRVETEINIPAGSIYIDLALSSLSGDCLFDDIRMFPKDASMSSYVYDPVNLRLVAELDERNYATLYEYDEEGKLVRVKKETEKGVMTIKENKNSTKKQ